MTPNDTTGAEPMPRTLAIAITLALSVTPAPGCGRSPKAPPPGGSLVVPDDTTYDFGEVYCGRGGEHVWTFRNAGSAAVTLKRGDVPCGCTSVTVGGGESAVVPPGGSVPVKVGWKTSVTNPAAWGQAVTVRSDDPATPEVKLKIKGKVKPVLVSSGGWGVAFPRYPRDQSRRITSTFYSPVKPDLRALGVSASSGLLRVSCQPATDRERSEAKVPAGLNAYTLVVEIPAASFRGKFREHAYVKFDLPEAQDVLYRVEGVSE